MHFPIIDILRAFAAFSVVIYHVIEIMGWTSFPVSGAVVWFRIGWMGVDLFFVISGLVISLSAFSRIEKYGNFRLSFTASRLARIVPLHYATCAIFLIFITPEILFQSDRIADIGFHALFIHNLSPNYQGSINGVNWSLGVEMQFYLLIGLCAPRLRKAPWWVIAVAAVCIAWGWRYYAFATTDITGKLGAYPRFWKSTQIPGTLDEFAVGILLARALVCDRGRQIFELGRRYYWAPVIVAVAAVWGSLSFFWSYDAAYWDSYVMVICYRTMLSAAFGCVVFAACCLRGRIVLAVTAPIRYFGTISYGIYLWQLPVILALHRIQWLSAPRALPFVLALTTVLAAGSWHFFEKPILDRVRAALRKYEADPFRLRLRLVRASSVNGT